MTYILQPYDDALHEILEDGVRKENRTGVDTLAIFGMQKRYRIDEHFPLLTKRKVWPKAIFGELLWFLSGSTNNKDLKDLGSNIWTPWLDEKFEEKHGYVSGAFGPVYGFQLRHFGGYYGNGNGGGAAIWNDSDGPTPRNWNFEKQRNATRGLWRDGNAQNVYGKDGFDQLEYMLKELKENPDSRRILFSLWNPKDMDKMRLPPCHFTFQLFVHGGKLSGHLTQRSCDFPVGVPANIQFYSALTYMFAQQAGYEPYEFVHTTVDSHIYVNQIEAVEEYLSRPTPDSPRLILHKSKGMLSYELDDFEVKEYCPEPKIAIQVEV